MTVPGNICPTALSLISNINSRAPCRTSTPKGPPLGCMASARPANGMRNPISHSSAAGGRSRLAGLTSGPAVRSHFTFSLIYVVSTSRVAASVEVLSKFLRCGGTTHDFAAIDDPTSNLPYPGMRLHKPISNWQSLTPAIEIHMPSPFNKWLINIHPLSSRKTPGSGFRIYLSIMRLSSLKILKTQNSRH